MVVGLLEECLYLLDAHDWIATGAHAGQLGEQGLDITLDGALFEPADFADGVHVKAITWHQLAVEQGPRGFEVTVFLDI